MYGRCTCRSSDSHDGGRIWHRVAVASANGMRRAPGRVVRIDEMRRALLLAFLVACGPSVAGGGTDAGVDATIDATPRPDADPTKASIEGHIWAPNLAPGIAPKGQEMPVFD